VSDIRDVWVRFDATGGGASISVDGYRESYTFPLGNSVSRYGSMGLLGETPDDGGEEVYKERLRAQLLAEIHNHGVSEALRRVFDITNGEWQ
jgi:hypothetical protein